MQDFIIPSLDPVNKPVHLNNYDYLVAKVNKGRSRVVNSTESRMIPSKQNKEIPKAFASK
jgi:hypothetical protein